MNRKAKKASNQAYILSTEAVYFLGEKAKENQSKIWAYQTAKHARNASDNSFHNLAKDLHQEAAKNHILAAEREASLGYHEAALKHKEAASLHNVAAEQHIPKKD